MVGDILLIKSNTDSAGISNATDFKSMVFERIESGKNKILVDLSDVALLDSTFLGALVVTHRKAVPAGGAVKLFGINESVRTLLGLTKLENVFVFYNTQEEAIQSFQK